MNDELFSPTIRDQAPPAKRPWRPESIVYPAFFGGPLAAATLGVLNGRRLALPVQQLLLIAGAGLVGFAGRVVVALSVDGTSAIRLAGTIGGIGVWLVVLAFQRRAFRVAVLRGVEAKSLIVPGLLAAVGLGLSEAMILAVVR
ncbi:hypothetical protein Aab01nite_01890 [Paractinoplanes abujensis]|uniref:Uncharacterized protein n=1 Tax=Paractinoplanes abujensis TaxID=882441 RepID=A0A7W7CRK2_9ACTN|nr:hypothetical protein [Actinoplanes abujensis]MBB4691983.1 hypothetical protein [Actinoplanes abujensis]GID16599.1 hypothetical protein Aab01nite_01890 [Actinoplanes abujensis]